MHQSPFEMMALSQSVNPADLGDAAVQGESVDMQGWDGVAFIATCGALGTGGTVDMKAQGSTDNSSFDTTMTDKDGTDVQITQVADDGDNKVYILDVWRPTKRYVRPEVDIGGTGVTVVVGVLALRYRRTGTLPMTHHADVGELKKFLAN